MKWVGQPDGPSIAYYKVIRESSCHRSIMPLTGILKTERHKQKPMAGNKFMFATGIENSYPTILLPNGKTKRVDEMEKTDHYNRWQEDFRTR